MTEDLDVAADTITKWRNDPKQQVRDLYGVEPDPWQADVLDAFASNDKDKERIAMQACAGPGKSAVLCWCGWNHLSCYASKEGHPKGAAVSISGDNLRDNLWSEFAKWQERSPFLMRAFTWTAQRIFAKKHPATWFLSARAFSKKANSEEQGRTLSGLHSPWVLILVDESGDIPIAVLKAGEQALSRCRRGKIVQAGNPTSHIGMLYAAVTEQADDWFVICINGDPDDPKRCPRIDIDWARKMIDKYGRDDPWVIAFILGRFPPTAINQLLGPDEVEAAMKRGHKKDAYQWSQKRLGVDVARFGDDRTIIFPRQGLVAMKEIEMRSATTPEIAARVASIKADWGSEVEFIDDTGGFGAGVIDSLNLAELEPQAVNFSSKAINRRYFNKRSEMWFEMATWVKKGGALPNSRQLKKELTTPTYNFWEGKIRIEEKDKIKSRLGWSPDMADALGLTFAMPDQPAAFVPPWKTPGFQREAGGGDQAQIEYDHTKE